MSPPRATDPRALFERHFTPAGPEDCWPWDGAISVSGYGVFTSGRRTRNAHAWAYLFYVGPVRVGLEVHHLCGSRNCVNPKHLRAITKTENMRHRRAITFPRAMPPEGKSIQVAFWGDLRRQIIIFAGRHGLSFSGAVKTLCEHSLGALKAQGRSA